MSRAGCMLLTLTGSCPTLMDQRRLQQIHRQPPWQRKAAMQLAAATSPRVLWPATLSPAAQSTQQISSTRGATTQSTRVYALVWRTHQRRDAGCLRQRHECRRRRCVARQGARPHTQRSHTQRRRRCRAGRPCSARQHWRARRQGLNTGAKLQRGQRGHGARRGAARRVEGTRLLKGSIKGQG